MADLSEVLVVTAMESITTDPRADLRQKAKATVAAVLRLLAVEIEAADEDGELWPDAGDLYMIADSVLAGGDQS